MAVFPAFSQHGVRAFAAVIIYSYSQYQAETSFQVLRCTWRGVQVAGFRIFWRIPQREGPLSRGRDWLHKTIPKYPCPECAEYPKLLSADVSRLSILLRLMILKMFTFSALLGQTSLGNARTPNASPAVQARAHAVETAKHSRPHTGKQKHAPWLLIALYCSIDNPPV